MPQYTPSNPTVSSSHRLRVSVRAFFARVGLVAALSSSAYLGLGALSGSAAAPIAQTAPTHAQMADGGPTTPCQATMSGC